MAAGGAERVASTLANAWALRGDDVMLMPTFSGRGDCFYELSPSVRLVYLADRVSSRAKSIINQISRLHALRRFIRAERPDVIVSFLSIVNVAAIFASAGLKVPVVICERTDPFVCPMPVVLRLACRFIYYFADALMVQTQAVATKYAVSQPALRPAWVIQNPVPQEFLDITCHTSRLKDRKLIAIGRLALEKQFDLLIRVFSRLADRHVDWSLRIVGDGSLRSDLQQQIAALGLASRVELPGRTLNIADELANASAFVMTSAYEGFPNALLEAMAVGLPCVTFDCPSGPREIAMDGQVALLVALNDESALEIELDRLMLDEEFRRAFGNEARTSVIARFALDKILAKWDVLFQGVGCRN